MTNDVEFIKSNMIGIDNNVEKMKIKVCNRGLTNAQLSKRVMELKYTGQEDEAKKLVDQNLMLDVFNIICLGEDSIENTKETSFRNLHSVTDATVTFTAQWTPIEYTITYDLDG